MRELKFRAWVNDHWVDWLPTSKTLGAYNEVGIYADEYETDSECFIEQYTGLKDKNGKEIYEGDIVLHDKIMLADTDGFFGEEKNVPCVVEWDSIRTGYYPFNYYDTEWGRYINGSDVEVIGNIHENEELLK